MNPELFSKDHEEFRAFLDYTKALVDTSLAGRDMLQLHGGDRRKSFPSDFPGETTTDVNQDNNAVCPEQLTE